MSAATAGAPPDAELSPDAGQIRAHFLALNRPGEVREVRALDHVPASGYGAESTASGYFDNPDDLVREVQGMGSASGVYITQNAVDPDLRARADNRLKRKARHTTADTDVARYTHITVDCDPKRKAGISATDTELARALTLRDAIVAFVTAELGWPGPVMTMLSGNGGHATWRIDLACDDEGRALVEDALKTVAALFDTPDVSIDTTLCNPSRIVKLAGTVAGKGDPLPHRPHRRARAEFAPEAGVVSEAHLRALVALAPVVAPAPASNTRTQNGRVLVAGRTVVTGGGTGEPYDVQALLRGADIGFTEHGRGDVRAFRLDRCLNSEDHNDGAAILQFVSGAVAYRCHHSRCAGVGWQDVKRRLGIEPSAVTASHDREREHGDPGPRATMNGRATASESPWPVLDDAALYGLAGDVVRAIEPHTEGDRVAILMNMLGMFGSAVGRAPHARVGATRHHANEFVVHVGETARSRKGTAYHEVFRLYTIADPGWCTRVVGGLSSGEGLIYAVRDAAYKLNKDGNEVLADAGVEDKRLLAVEPEFASVLRVATRDGNTVSEILRRSWDGDNLRTLTKNSPLIATHPHIALLGHITKPELLRELSEASQANGWANRHLFVCVRRSKMLPHGGALGDADVNALARRVRNALLAARTRGELRRDAEANRMWEAVYPALTSDRPGMLGAITARGEAHVLRLSLLYALLDDAPAIGKSHLAAALALWQYCEESARFIFGDATGDPIADRVLAALRSNGPMTQNELTDLFGRHVRSAALGRALEALVSAGMVASEQVKTDGRPRTVWKATS